MKCPHKDCLDNRDGECMTTGAIRLGRVTVDRLRRSAGQEVPTRPTHCFTTTGIDILHDPELFAREECWHLVQRTMYRGGKEKDGMGRCGEPAVGMIRGVCLCQEHYDRILRINDMKGVPSSY